MTYRTTLSLNSEYVLKLKTIAQNKKQKSLSQLVNFILKDFLEAYENNKKFKKLEEGYKQYAKNFDAASSQEIESAALYDLAAQQ